MPYDIGKLLYLLIASVPCETPQSSSGCHTPVVRHALVPTDIGKPTSRYLHDIELAALLQRIVDKGLVVTVVLDSCHSGGTTRVGESDIRGADRETVDTMPRPTDSLVASAEDLAKTWQRKQLVVVNQILVSCQEPMAK